MNLVSGCNKKIACFGCDAMNEHTAERCSVCRFDIASEISERRITCHYLRLEAAAFALGAVTPMMVLLMIGGLGSRELPALGAGVIILAIAECSWIWSLRLSPKYVIEPITDDLRSVIFVSWPTDRQDPPRR